MVVDKNVAESTDVTGLERLSAAIGVLAEGDVSGGIEIGEPVAQVAAGQGVRSLRNDPVGLEMPT